MAAIRSTNTKPELALRKALRALGHTGYRIHRKDLPGRPDVAFISKKVAVFVDGAYWHGHPDHWHPDRADEYWRAKITRNIERDASTGEELRLRGWQVVRFWDFEVNADPVECAERVAALLTS